MQQIRLVLVALATTVALPAAAPFAAAAPSRAGAASVKTFRVNWHESTKFSAGTVTVHVSKIVIRDVSWSVTASFQNRSPVALQISRGEPSLRQAGMSLLWPAPYKSGVFANFTVLLARSFSPRLPSTLGAGARWSGTFTGNGVLPRMKLIYVGFGLFQVASSSERFNWVTDHGFRL